MKRFFQNYPTFIDLLGVLLGLGAHLWYLFHTTFVDWPEMMIYPYFASRGLVYYRDMSVPFPPLINYILSLGYGILGFSPAAERIIAYLFILGTDVLVYLLVRRLTKHRLAAWGSLLFFVFWQPIFYGNALWHEIIIAPVMLGAFLAVLGYHRAPTQKSMLWLGLAFTTLSLMKQTVIWPMTVAVLFLLITAKEKKTTVSHLFWVGLMMLAAHAIIWAMYAVQGGGYQYLFWVYQFPVSLTGADTYYKIPMTRSDLLLLLPAFLPLVALPFFRKKHTVPYLLLLPLTVSLWLMALPRWGIFRLEPALTFGAIGFGLFLASLPKLRKNIWSVASVAIFLLMLGLGWRSFRVYTTLRDPMQPQFFAAQYEALLRFARANVRGPLFILGNYDYLYFGLNTAPTVKPWIPMFPWNGQIPGAQESVIRSMQETKVPYVFYIPYHGTTGFYDAYYPEHLVTFIKTHYDKVSDLPIPGGIFYQLRLE